MDYFGGEGSKGAVARKMASYTAPKDLVLPTEGDGEEEEGFEDVLGKSRRIVDRESDYQKRRLNRQLSPPRVDPFAAAVSGGGGGGAKATGMRSYVDAAKEANEERARFDKLRELQEQERKREEEGTGEVDVSAAPRSDSGGRKPHEDTYSHRRGDRGDRFGRDRDRSRSPARGSGRHENFRGGGNRWSDDRRGGPRSQRGDRDGGRPSKKKEEEFAWGKPEDQELNQPEAKEPAPANFGLSGLLAEESLTVKGVKLKYTEPSEGRKPDKMWRLYVFKSGKPIQGEGGVLHVHRQSMYLCGRERKVVSPHLSPQ